MRQKVESGKKAPTLHCFGAYKYQDVQGGGNVKTLLLGLAVIAAAGLFERQRMKSSTCARNIA